MSTTKLPFIVAMPKTANHSFCRSCGRHVESKHMQECLTCGERTCGLKANDCAMTCACSEGVGPFDGLQLV